MAKSNFNGKISIQSEKLISLLKFIPKEFKREAILYSPFDFIQPQEICLVLRSLELTDIKDPQFKH